MRMTSRSSSLTVERSRVLTYSRILMVEARESHSLDSMTKTLLQMLLTSQVLNTWAETSQSRRPSLERHVLLVRLDSVVVNRTPLIQRAQPVSLETSPSEP